MKKFNNETNLGPTQILTHLQRHIDARKVRS